MLTEQGVAAAYQLLLGRLPESEEIVRRFVETNSFDTLRDAILGSEEFASRVADRPGLLDLHPWVTAGCRATRLGCRQLEHLAALNLPVWGRTVLCPGGEAGLHASFFVDRLCKVVVPTRHPNAVTAVQERLRRMCRRGAADRIEVRFLDLAGGVIRGGAHASQIVSSHGELPAARDLGRFLTNLSTLCTEILILDARVGFGAGETVAVARESITGRSIDVGVPTRQWIWARLAQDFAHVYVPRTQPCHDDYALSWRSGQRNAASSRAVFVAARTPLDETDLSSVLLDTQTAHAAWKHP